MCPGTFFLSDAAQTPGSQLHGSVFWGVQKNPTTTPCPTAVGSGEFPKIALLKIYVLIPWELERRIQ
jgi:hypothetical protein